MSRHPSPPRELAIAGRAGAARGGPARRDARPLLIALAALLATTLAAPARASALPLGQPAPRGIAGARPHGPTGAGRRAPAGPGEMRWGQVAALAAAVPLFEADGAAPLRGVPYAEPLAAAAAGAGLDPWLVAAVARAESSFDPRAESATGARGLMQLTDGTARLMGVGDVFNPTENAAAGAGYLAGLAARFGGDPALALAAYNAGPGAVERWGGVPPYPETRAYLWRVVDAYRALGGAAVAAAALEQAVAAALAAARPAD